MRATFSKLPKVSEQFQTLHLSYFPTKKPHLLCQVPSHLQSHDVPALTKPYSFRRAPFSYAKFGGSSCSLSLTKIACANRSAEPCAYAENNALRHQYCWLLRCGGVVWQ